MLYEKQPLNNVFLLRRLWRKQTTLVLSLFVWKMKASNIMIALLVVHGLARWKLLTEKKRNNSISRLGE